jgi:hypothetical protein
MRKLLVLALVLVLGATPALAYNYTAPSSSVARGPVATIMTAGTTAASSTVITTDYKVGVQVITLFWHGTCSGGTVIIETADLAAFDHTWVPLATISAHSNIEDHITLTYPTHSVRARISSDITGGGNLTVYYTGVNY